MRFFALIFCLILAGNAIAQAPGYIGKRTIVELGVTGAPSILYGIEEGLWGPDLECIIGAERVMSRRISLSVSAWAMSSRARYANPQLEGGFARVSALGLNGSIRFYHYRRSGVPAPVGPYHELGLGALQYRLRDLDGIYNPQGERRFGPYADGRIFYRLGTRSVIKDRFCWNIALELGTLFSLPQTNFRAQVGPRDLGRARLIRHSAIGLHIGFGVLLDKKP
ncbi:MAG: hypothetical protein AB8F95_17065 [Bacteroidia bacterium]